MHTHIFTHLHLERAHTQHIPFSWNNSHFKSSPNKFILGLPCTAMTMSQTSIKVFIVHVFFKHAWRHWFCCVLSKFRLIILRSPFEMIPWCSSSNTMAGASTSATNRSRKWSRTCSAWQGEGSEMWYTHVSCNMLTLPLYYTSSSITPCSHWPGTGCWYKHDIRFSADSFCTTFTSIIRLNMSSLLKVKTAKATSSHQSHNHSTDESRESGGGSPWVPRNPFQE